MRVPLLGSLLCVQGLSGMTLIQAARAGIMKTCGAASVKFRSEGTIQDSDGK